MGIFSVSAFGDELKRLMRSKGVTQVELAESANVYQSYISKLITGDNPAPGATVLFKIADALEVPIDHFRPYFTSEPAARAKKRKHN